MAAVTLRLQSPPTLFPRHHLSTLKQHRITTTLRAFSSLSSSPVLSSVTTFAPATVANLGPCFDFLGAAVDSLGDHVTLSLSPSSHNLTISHISGAPSLSLDPLLNCAGIAALAALKRLGIREMGLTMTLNKGLPLGSGLGSSAASAAAAAVAVNAMFGGRLTETELVKAGLESEAKVSGYHADNIGPAIMGGFVMIRSYEPLDLVRVRFPEDKELLFVLVSPEFEAPTKKMRAVLKGEVGMEHHVWNCSQAGALVAAVIVGDLVGFGKAMSGDRIVEPKRAPLIPGMEAVKRAALEAGAFGCTISGAGPTAVAVVGEEEKGREVGERMVEAFARVGKLKAKATVTRLDRVGARVVDSEPL
ncbi:Homoserine kinase-like protein [Drosera capensis]